jgi:hypothetical protein
VKHEVFLHHQVAPLIHQNVRLQATTQTMETIPAVLKQKLVVEKGRREPVAQW